MVLCNLECIANDKESISLCNMNIRIRNNERQFCLIAKAVSDSEQK
jgi:hypothetical protein